MCLDTKFYIFWNFFTIFLDLFKIAIFYGPYLSKKQRFSIDLKNIKKIPKNVKFGLQTHINMDNMMNGLDQLFGL